jgi:hypothetical protein
MPRFRGACAVVSRSSELVHGRWMLCWIRPPQKGGCRHKCDHDAQTPPQITKLCCCFRLQTLKPDIHRGDCCCFRLQTRKPDIPSDELLIHPREVPKRWSIAWLRASKRWSITPLSPSRGGFSTSNRWLSASNRWSIVWLSASNFPSMLRNRVSSITAASGTTLAGRSSAPTLRRKASYSSESSLLFRRLTSISLSAARREFATGHSVSLD